MGLKLGVSIERSYKRTVPHMELVYVNGVYWHFEREHQEAFKWYFSAAEIQIVGILRIFGHA